MLSERLPSPGQGIALAMHQALDFKGNLDVAAAIKALAGSTLVGLELRKLSVSQKRRT